MFNHLFQGGNPTGQWQRGPGLQIAVDLSAPSINGIKLGQTFNNLEFLGCDENKTAAKDNSFRYYSLGLEIDRGSDDIFQGFSIILDDPEGRHQPFAGAVTWLGSPVELTRIRQNDLGGIFGDCYWSDTDDDETIVFYEFQEYEMQIECTEYRISRVVVTRDPIMASKEQRTAYGVTKPYPF
jgi:hypothetical protein